MKSKAKAVEEYINEAPAKRREALLKIRQLCLATMPDHEESMAYKMPSYKRNDQVQVAFASQKQHICVYVLIHEVMLTNVDRLKGMNHGKGCIRFSNPEKVNFELLEHLFIETAKSDSTIC